ncbi:MAG: fluoride efflux transporter CrcB [Planctomycetota bacterium]
MTNILLVALGGSIGATMRYLLAAALQRGTASALPLGTFTVNVIGSFVIGLVAVLITGPWVLKEQGRLLLMTGVLGGFTTFSSFALESLTLANQGQPLRMLAYIGATNVIGIGAAFLGWFLGDWWTR